MFWFIAFLIFLGVLGYGLNSYLYGNSDYWPKHGIPYVSVSEMGPFWERINFRIPVQDMQVVVYQKLKSLGKSVKFGGVMELRNPVVFLTDLDLIRLVTVKDFDHFVNRRPLGRKDDPTRIHEMLFALEDTPWKNMRAAMSPTFTTGKIRRVFEVFIESSKKLQTFLKTEVKNAGADGIEMKEVFGRYTMDVIASAAFGVDSQNFKDKNSTFAQMGRRFQGHFFGIFGAIRQFSSLYAPELFKLFRWTFLDPTSYEFFSSVIERTIRHREETGEKRNDFLQLILEAKDGNLKGDENENEQSEMAGQLKKSQKVAWTQDMIVSQCIVFIFGGFDTTETLLVFAAYELALNQDVQKRLVQEIEGVVGKNEELTYEVVNELEYLDQVISETLRKYPPAQFTERKCTKNYKIPGSTYEVPKDMTVQIPIWSIHHDPEIYPDPEKFIPSRFSSQEKAKRHQYAYLPFGVGPRNCIAMRFAITEGKAAIAHLVRHFHLEPTGRTTIPMKFQVSGPGQLKPLDGMYLKVTPRD